MFTLRNEFPGIIFSEKKTSNILGEVGLWFPNKCLLKLFPGWLWADVNGLHYDNHLKSNKHNKAFLRRQRDALAFEIIGKE